MSVETALVGQTKKEISKTWNLIVQQFSQEGKLDQALKDRREQLQLMAEMFFGVWEQKYKEKHGRDFDEISEEEVDEIVVRIAGAMFEIASETDIERIEMIASSIAGATFLKNRDKIIVSAAMRAIRKLDPLAIRLLIEECPEEQKSDLGIGDLGAVNRLRAGVFQEHIPEWIGFLESAGCIQAYPVYGEEPPEEEEPGGIFKDPPISDPEEQDRYRPTPYVETRYKLTVVGYMVLEILAPYIQKRRTGADASVFK